MLHIFRIAVLSIFFGFFYSPIFSEVNIRTESLIGTTEGLFFTSDMGEVTPLWTGGEVFKIIESQQWYFLTSEGILTSADLQTFTLQNGNLPVNIIKQITNGQKEFITRTQLLKDLEVHATDSSIMVTATKDAVYLSKDTGQTWTNIGSTARTSGIKAVAVASMKKEFGIEEELVVFMSHAIYGLAYYRIEEAAPKWVDVIDGFELVPEIEYADELSDIVTFINYDEQNRPFTEVYMTRSFKPQIYRFDWTQKKAQLIWESDQFADTIDGLTYSDGSLFFTRQYGISELNLKTLQINDEPFYPDWWRIAFSQVPGYVQCTSFTPTYLKFPFTVHLSELWLLNPSAVHSDYIDIIKDRKGIYVPPNQIRTAAGQEKFLDVLEKNNLDTFVIDMKDDKGLLRYYSNDEDVLKKAYVSDYSIDLDTFIPKMKENNVYLIARIVVFKDKHLASIDNGDYAVWDHKYRRPWQGIRRTNDEGVVEYYDENWVDPYSEEVWAYNVAIANELIARGFDEIQFDYIRFPTDGLNMSNITYRWQEHGMDKESALMSFLSHARNNIDAPISIDIYGANGWYRTGARTGQDVELLAQYVDAISPMFYPSHFEQPFMAYPPAVERPYRIYYYGTYRNAVIARNKVLIRPWAQAFYLNVSYDREYYDNDYVQRQIFGMRDSVNQGYLYWNNIGRYDDLRPDIDIDTPYPWESPEVRAENRFPALGGE